MKKILIILAIILIVFAGIAIANVKTYKMAVNVTAEENAIGVNPSTDVLDFGDLPRNNAAVRYITVANSGKVPVYILILKFGELSNLVKGSKSFLSVDPGQEQKLSFMLDIPSSAKNRKYTGNLLVFHFPKFF